MTDHELELTPRRTVLAAAAAFAGTSGVVSAGDDDQSEANDDEGNGPEDGHGDDATGDDADLEGAGLVTVAGGDSVAATTEAIENRIDGLEAVMHVATIDHAANAASVDEDLRPTRVVLFGNPALGTPLMQASQSAGIDLPQKLLVWEDEAGDVRVTYNDPEYVAERHGIEGQDERLATIAGALRTIATGETGSEGGGCTE